MARPRARVAETVPLGFTVGPGEWVAIPLAHTCVTGQSQQAGKTTALEGLVARSGKRAITFVTKRGEESFARGRRLAPYFRERADWLFVASLIDATMGEKNKLLRSFLMKVCRTTKTLADVQLAVREARAAARVGTFPESIYTEIEGYLDLVLPQIAQLPPPAPLIIRDGLNVMDLAPYRVELQGLIIRSVLEHVYEHESDVVTVIPEAWEFLPEQRGSPVKLAFETLVRKGAGLRNYVYIDSQDLAGVWKLAIRACPVILIGVQREANEIKRTRENIPAGIAKPSAAAIAGLGLGEFYACWSTHVHKVYAQPEWMMTEDARRVATGQLDAVNASLLIKPFEVPDIFERRREEATVTEDEAKQLRQENERLKRGEAAHHTAIEALKRRIADLERERTPPPGPAVYRKAEGAEGYDHQDEPAPPPSAPALPPMASAMALTEAAVAAAGNGHALDEDLYQALKARLLAEAPEVFTILDRRPEILVEVQRTILPVDGTTVRGRVLKLVARDFFSEERALFAVRKELARTGSDPGGGGSLGALLATLVAERILNREPGGFVRASGVQIGEREITVTP